MSQTIYRKYRPQTFADVTGQEHIKRTIQNQLKHGKVAHAYLFTGSRGVGKTTTARLLAKTVNCEQWHSEVLTKDPSMLLSFEPCNVCAACREITAGSFLDVYEMDAASNTGVDHVRENIIEHVRFTPVHGRYKVYIIDEVHMLSPSAFNALLKTLEEPPAHVLFILATTEIHKVPATIISRCQRFDFRRLTADETVARLQILCAEEQVKVAEEVLRQIARQTEGCERDAESMLGQLLALGEQEIGFDEASLVLPITPTQISLDFLDALVRGDVSGAIGLLNSSLEDGIEISSFLDETVLLLRTALLGLLGGGLERFQTTFDEETAGRVMTLGKTWNTARLSQAIERFLDARRTSKMDVIPQLSTELAVIDLCSTIPPAAVKEEISISKPPKKSDDLHPPSPLVAENISLNTSASSEPVVFGDIPVIDVEEVRKKWPEVFQKIQECNASLPLIVRSGDLVGVEGNTVELRFAYSLHAETVNRDKNRRLIEEILKKVLGKTMYIRAVHTQESTALEGDDAVSTLLREFGGQAI